MSRAPNGLSDRAKAFWRQIMAVYALDAAEQLWLKRACKTISRIDQLEELIADTVLLYDAGSGVFRPNAAWGMLAEQERILDLEIRAMALPLPGETEGHRRSPQQADGAAVMQKRRRGTVGHLGAVAD
jgi:hypothetical protein